jgi:hypothetical protein
MEENSRHTTGKGVPVPTRTRVALSALLGLLCAWATWRNFGRSGPHTDFSQLWAAARAILHGQNPAHVIGPGLAFQWTWPILYPLPADLIALPFVPLSEHMAPTVFAIFTGAAFAWALTEHGMAPMAGFFSSALMVAVTSGQWSPLLAGATAVPWLGVLFIAKPTVGAAYFTYRPTWWPIIGGAILAGISFLIEPTWVADWFAAIRQNAAIWYPDTSYRAIVSEPGGILALLCLLRWRRPEARLVAAIACVPLTPMPYELVALFLVPRTAGEAALLAAASWALQFRLDAVIPHLATFGQRYDYTGQLMALTLYPLATIMVLRRPNEGTVPAWFERRIAQWPPWLRGRAQRTALS